MRVSVNALDRYRNALKDGVEFLGTRTVVDDDNLRRGGRMATTVHPLFLPANSVEVLTLLLALQEYAAAHGREPKAEIASNLAGEIHSQLTGHAKGLVDPALRGSGCRVPRDMGTEFVRDDRGARCPYYIATLEKATAHVQVSYTRGDGSSGIACGRVELVGPEPGCVGIRLGDGDVISIPYDKINDVQTIS